MKELLIIKLFCKDRSNWLKYYQLIKGLNLDKELLLLFSLVENYYEAYPEHQYIGQDELKSFFQLEYSTYKSGELIEKLIEDIYKLEVSDSLIKDYIETVLEKDTATKIINKLLKVVDESESGLLVSVEEDLQKFKDATDESDRDDSIFVSDDLCELFSQEDSTNQINWRLKCLQESVGPLKEGLVHVFARTNVGKTSWLVSEITNFCHQLGDDEYILYFNNEEAGRQVKYRFYTAMLNTPLDKLKSSTDTAKLAMETYAKRGGHKLKLYDKDVFSVEDIDRFCYDYKPRIVVVDVADKVHFRGMGQLEGAQRLKELYRRYREISKRHKCTVITSAQASADAAGKKWLDLIHMDMSKTGKPAELDLSIGIGACTDEGKENIRYIHINKNKWNGRHDKLTALIDPYTGRYSDMEG